MSNNSKPLAPTSPPKKKEETKKESAPTPATTVSKTALVPVFVYGSLKKDFQLNSYLKGQQFVGPAVVHGHILVTLGQYPAMIQIDDDKYQVVGEYYLVSPDCFDAMRQMEERAGYHTHDVEGHFATNDNIPVLKDSKFKAKAWVFDTVYKGMADWTCMEYQGQDWLYVDYPSHK